MLKIKNAGKIKNIGICNALKFHFLKLKKISHNLGDLFNRSV